MIRKTLLAAAAVFAITAIQVASAEQPLLDYVVTSCEIDLENFCSQVTPGEGRLMHCVAAHEDKLSGQCVYALYQAASLLEELSVAIGYLAAECGTDIEAHCANVEVGEGRMLSCLGEHKEEVSESCTQAITDTIAE
jgi:hypothetical protein